MKNQVNLTEYIHDEMDLFFVALNAPEKSNNNGHWFSRNLSFWNVLFDAGIITGKITNALEGDVKVFGSSAINFNNWIIGVTDLNREVVQTNSQGVITNDEQVQRILKILDAKKVKRLVLMHSKVATAFEEAHLIRRNFNNGTNAYGKVGQCGDTEIFQVPFHNASIENKAVYYRFLIQETSEDKEPSSKIKIHPAPETKDTSGSNFARVSFTLPDSGNSITEADIKKATLRITVSFKGYFPSSDSALEMVFKDQSYQVKYVKRVGRSDLLKLGRDLISKIGLKAYGSVKISKIGTNKYEIKKT